MGSGNAYTPTTPAQIRYIIQWFQEWGEMQRSDFLPILVQKFSIRKSINGLVSSLDSCNVNDRPPSIFQCRIKLFKEWSENWNETEKEQLLDQIRSIDTGFMQKYDEKINGSVEFKSDEVGLTNGDTETVTD